MSTRKFEAFDDEGRPVRVHGGWDAPLGYLYLGIYRIGDDGDDVETLFTNLDLDDPGMSIPEIVRQLESRGLPVPDEWLGRIVLDRHNNVGNDETDYGFQGSLMRLMMKREQIAADAYREGRQDTLNEKQVRITSK